MFRKGKFGWHEIGSRKTIVQSALDKLYYYINLLLVCWRAIVSCPTLILHHHNVDFAANSYKSLLCYVLFWHITLVISEIYICLSIDTFFSLKFGICQSLGK